MKKNLLRLIAAPVVFISMLNLAIAQNPDTPTQQTPVQQPPSPYPVPPSPVPAPNQIPQDPTIPKLTIPANAPTDSVFKKIDHEDKPFRLQPVDSSATRPRH